MKKELVIDVSEIEVRAALLEEGKVVEFFFERSIDLHIAGNIFKGIVENVLPGIQSAFVNIGLDKNAFLFAGDMLLEDKEKPRRIEELLHPGQELVVQVTKEPMGTKGARVSTKITLPGRYVVLMPGIDFIGVSHRVSSSSERERLRKIAESCRPQGMGIILRTVAEGRSKKEIEEDIQTVVRLWKRILEKAEIVAAPAVLYEEASLVFTLIRDLFDEEMERVWINSFLAYQKMRDFIESLMPGFGERVRFFESRENIFEHFGIEKELARALSRKVWLKSGGYLVFDRTEAMTVVDVNTGKFVGKKDLQETVLKTNLEAAEEIARQVRLRDIGGIILIDFIDMNKKEHRKQVIKTLENSLLKDRTRCSVIDMSDLGLVEMTRKRVKKGLDYFLQEPCSNCKGEGKVLSLETIAVGFLRKLEEICRNSSAEFVGATVGSELKQYLDEVGEKFVERLERIYKKKIKWRFDANLPSRRYSIVGVGSEEEIRKKLEEIA